MRHYIKQTRRTDDLSDTVTRPFKKYSHELHYLMGMMTELGEIVDIYKKGIMYDNNQTINIDKFSDISKEVGDMFWYLARFLDHVGLDPNTVMEDNILKLKKRFPEKFCGKKARQQADVKK